MLALPMGKISSCNLTVIFFLVVLFNLEAQLLLPPIQNYPIFEYQAASNNWDLAVDPEGELYVANGKGLLHYNGEQWALYPLPNKTIIRSVAWIEERIYTGSYEEFGYWEKNDFGGLDYTSLTHLIGDHQFTSEEFWQILPFGEGIAFRSFTGIYVYKDNGITMLEPRFVMNHMVVWKDRIFVAGGQNGLSYIQNRELFPVEGTTSLADKIVVELKATSNGLIIGTKLHGAYLLTDDGLKPFPDEINKELKQHQLNQVLPLANGKLAFGTIKNGIYFYDWEQDTYQCLNREVGLQNNTVLALVSYGNQLWVGLDNGIDRLQIDNPLTYYTDYSGAVGTVYDLAQHNNTFYLGSNTGIHYFERDSLKFVPGSQGHIWNLEVMEGDLLCGHNTGTFKLENGTLNKISDISGGYQLVKVPTSKSLYLQGTYTGLARFHKDVEGNWKVAPIQGISFPVKYLTFENPSTLWVAHPYKGLYRIILNREYNKVVHKQEFGLESIPNNYNIKLFNIKNQIVFYIEGIWYKYDPIVEKIILFEEFQDYNHKDLVHFDENNYWFIDNEGDKELLVTNLRDDQIILQDAQLGKRLIPAAEKMEQLNDSIYFFTLSDGFSKLNLAKLRRHLQNFELTTPKLVWFIDEDTVHSLQELPLDIPYKASQHITLEVAAPNLLQPRYFYELKGPLEQSGVQEMGSISFHNLPYGNYNLNVHTIGIDGNRSHPKQVAFSIRPPWYFSTVSFVLYGFMGVLVILLVRWINKRKLDRKHRLLKENLERQKEEQLAQLEKEKLAREVRMKQKELASTTMSMARKNELILELKNLLVMNKSKFDNQQRYRSFMKKLNSAISDDEDWRHFEVNFKELHNDFFETLLQRYPKLTPKDLKLCAYLKMNLSSKEIAPLMGISTRGVEIHRYRLRKKLELNSEQNISNFLITMK